MIKDKDIEKRLEAEGEEFTPHSFSAIKSQVLLSQKHVEHSLEKEGETFVPNEYPAIQAQVMPEQPKAQYHFNKKSWITVGVLGAVTLGLAAVLIVNVNNTTTVAAVNLTVSVADTGEDTITRTTTSIEDPGIDVYFCVNDNYKTDPESYSGSSDNAKMIFAAMKQENNNPSESVELFSTKILDYSIGVFITSGDENSYTNYTVNIAINSPSESLNTKLSEKIQSSISEFGEENYINFTYTTESSSGDNGDITNEIIKKAKNLFFQRGGHGGNEGYLPEGVRTPFELDSYLPEDEEEQQLILDRLSIFDSYEREDDYRKISECLHAIYGIYLNRKDQILHRLHEIDSILGVEETDYEADLPSPYWWDNDYSHETYDEESLLNFYEYYYNYIYQTSETTTDFINEKCDLIVLLETNQKWFSFSFEIANSATKPNTDDQPGGLDDVPWFGDGENGFDGEPPEGYDGWDDYWYDQYQNNGGHGRP